MGQAVGGGLVTRSNRLKLYTTGPDGRLIEGPESGFLSDVHLVPALRTNAIIVTAPTKTMQLIEKLIEELDTVAAAAAYVKVFSLKTADANLTANLLRQLFLGQTTGGGALGGAGGLGGLGGAGGQANTLQTRPLITVDGSIAPGAALIGLQIAVDDRTNSLIVAGSESDLDMIAGLIGKLESSDTEERLFEVYKLRNSAAADVANAINTFITNAVTLEQNASTATGQTFFTAYQQIQRNVVVQQEPVSNTLLISATPRYFSKLKQLIERIDAQPPQVVIQVLIADVQLTNTQEFGIEFGLQSPVLFNRGGLASPGFNFNTSAPLGSVNATEQGNVGFQSLGNLNIGRTSTTGAGFGGLVLSASSQSFNLLIRALKAQNRVEILSRPQVQVMDNQAGFIQVGQDFPVPTNVNVTGLTTQQGVEYRQIGVVMRVTPRITPDGKVIMRVEPQISSVSPQLISLGGGLQAPAFNIQTVQTTVLASDGETIVLGGLVTKQDNREQRGIPFLSDIPYAGALFRYRSHQVTRREVLIIMTPHIMRSEADQARILAEESAKMHWCLPDAAAIHGHGMEVMGPASQGARVVPTNAPSGAPGGHYVPGPSYFGSMPGDPSAGANVQPGFLPPNAQPYYPGVSPPVGTPAVPGHPMSPVGPVGSIGPMAPPMAQPATGGMLPPTPTITPAAMLPGSPGSTAPVVPAAAIQPAATPPPGNRSYRMDMPKKPEQPAGNGSPAQPAVSRNTDAMEGRLKWDVFGR